MSFTTFPYCSPSDVYDALDLSVNSQANDWNWIAKLVTEAQSDIDRELGFSFQTDGTSNSPSTRLYDGEGTRVLFFYVDRVQLVTKVIEQTNNMFLNSSGLFLNGTSATLDITADCVTQPNYGTDGAWKMVRRSGLPFQSGIQNYQVRGVFGRSTIPSDIARACTRLAVHYYKMRDTNYADQIMEQGMVRMKYNKPIPEDVMEILNRYKPRMFMSGGGPVGGSAYGY